MLLCKSSCLPFLEVVNTTFPGIKTMAVRIGTTLQEDVTNSFLMKADDQVSYVCQMINREPKMSRGYNAVGFSQGGLLMRGVAQRCPEPPIKSLITFGSPHQGIFGVPECRASVGSKTLCEMMRRLLSFGAYHPWVQGANMFY